METANEKQPVITLNDESFKHYLIERYSGTNENSNWQKLKDASQELISSETWVQLFNHAKEDLAKKGGSLIGYELVNNILLSHDGVTSHWPMNWMWVIRF
ncbi:hypothetical protein LZD49_12325 [Dyadobacter sp. CY261]|uniref:hypothetical protein n=1 Tax=Dyadobacter sp. CY261 TaxID=2907203 RepID=UPI001F24DAB0|nr:hypothetical protein [Dyadobacter sp. CY261]MCF0071259.1 hypothetical protein [Dyadobacter sp. CY261]